MDFTCDRLLVHRTAVLFFISSLLTALGTRPACADTNNIPGMVLHFSMDELRANAFTDLVSSNALGHANGVRIAAQGKLGSAAEFTAKNSSIQVPDGSALNPRQLTFALWFKTDRDTAAVRTLAEKNAAKGYALTLLGGGKENPKRGKLRASVCGRDIVSAAPVTDGLWHHAALTFDGETAKLYIDGSLQKPTAACQGEIASASHDLMLGASRSAPTAREKETPLGGVIDEVTLFSRALDSSEIKRLISSAKPKFTKQQVERRLKELKELLDRGLILQDFYDRKVEECEVVE